ncbi:MFS transporter, sugar porter (SP) family [Kytococcus aerolatus]|uniref:MFS transporter, sugar porter (SP) family n=1 Tax=Kytococcus aerolatus TaxID=592308 RepID=A0A212TGU2_9MICO|nr:MFS transporter, sugar porter (SP) family [Kytococcus aerolatus]
MVPTDREANSGSQVVMLALVAALGGFLFGYDSAVINGGVNAIGERFDLSPGMLGFVVSCALLGAMAGAWFAGSLADRIGRTRAMVVAAIFFTLSAIGSWATVTAWDLVLWRALGGAGIGMASVLAPAYIAEISPSQVRGRLGSLQQLAIVVGLFSALLVDAWLAGLAGGAAQDLWFGLEAWRWMFLSELLPALVYGALALSIPESPRFMVAQGKEAEAAHLLRDVVGLRGEEVEAKLDDIRATINTEKRQTLSDLAGAAAGLKPIVWIGILLSVFQQFVGINVIFYFGSTLWQAVGFGESQALLINVGTSITNIVVTVVAILIVDRVGRRPMLLAGSAGMTLSLAAMALAFSHATVSGSGAEQSVSLPDPWGPIALAAANLFIVAFGITWGPIVWVLLGEMFPNNIRSVALGVAAAAQWLANFVITTTFPWLADVSLTLAYGLYAAFSLLSLVFVWRYVGETRGKELEEMGDGAHQRVAAPVPA